jgi:hypothetical protein
MANEVSVRLGYGAVSLAVWFPKFRDQIVASSSRVSLETRQDETTTLSRNVGNQTPNDAARHKPVELTLRS